MNKFRVWDKTRQRFFYDGDLSNLFAVDGHGNLLEYMHSGTWEEIEDNNYVVSYYTGLDYVYQGDMIKYTNHGCEYTANVVWNNAQLSWCTDNGLQLFLCENIEVIGNIYKNG